MYFVVIVFVPKIDISSSDKNVPSFFIPKGLKKNLNVSVFILISFFYCSKFYVFFLKRKVLFALS